MQGENRIGVEMRTGWEDVTKFCVLPKDMTGQEIVDILEHWLVDKLNEERDILCLGADNFQTGKFSFICVEQGAEKQVLAGTSGGPPSTHTVLITDAGDDICLDETYKKGSKFCFLHCRWESVPFSSHLPIVHNAYMHIRKCAITWLSRFITDTE